MRGVVIAALLLCMVITIRMFNHAAIRRVEREQLTQVILQQIHDKRQQSPQVLPPKIRAKLQNVVSAADPKIANEVHKKPQSSPEGNLAAGVSSSASTLKPQAPRQWWLNSDYTQHICQSSGVAQRSQDQVLIELCSSVSRPTHRRRMANQEAYVQYRLKLVKDSKAKIKKYEDAKRILPAIAAWCKKFNIYELAPHFVELGVKTPEDALWLEDEELAMLKIVASSRYGKEGVVGLSNAFDSIEDAGAIEPHNEKTVNIIYCFYHVANTTRMSELVSSLQWILMNPYVQAVHILLQASDQEFQDSVCRDLPKSTCTDKVHVIKLSSSLRITYTHLFIAANMIVQPDHVAVIQNSDIYFDESLRYVPSMLRIDDAVLTLSRRPTRASWKTARKTMSVCTNLSKVYENDMCEKYIGSHDAFMFRPLAKKNYTAFDTFVSRINHSQNIAGAENVVIWELARNEYKVSPLRMTSFRGFPLLATMLSLHNAFRVS